MHPQFPRFIRLQVPQKSHCRLHLSVISPMQCRHPLRYLTTLVSHQNGAKSPAALVELAPPREGTAQHAADNDMPVGSQGRQRWQKVKEVFSECSS